MKNTAQTVSIEVEVPAGEAFDIAKHGKLLPPKAGHCQQCAVPHEPGLPHNQQSLFWQYWFYQRNSRWPTWVDAMAHCTDEVRSFWQHALVARGVDRKDVGL